MSNFRLRSNYCNDRLAAQQHPGSKINNKVVKVTAKQKIIKNLRGSYETAPVAGNRPLSSKIGKWGITPTIDVKMSKVSNSRLSPYNILTEVAPTGKTLNIQTINKINSGLLPSFITSNTGIKKIVTELLKLLKNNNAKLIAMELIKGSLAGKKYDELVKGGTIPKNAKANDAYQKLLANYTDMVNAGNLDNFKVQEDIKKFEKELSDIYGNVVYNNADVNQLQKLATELSNMSNVMTKIYNQDVAGASQQQATSTDIYNAIVGLYQQDQPIPPRTVPEESKEESVYAYYNNKIDDIKKLFANNENITPEVVFDIAGSPLDLINSFTKKQIGMLMIAIGKKGKHSDNKKTLVTKLHSFLNEQQPNVRGIEQPNVWDADKPQYPINRPDLLPVQQPVPQPVPQPEQEQEPDPQEVTFV